MSSFLVTGVAVGRRLALLNCPVWQARIRRPMLPLSMNLCDVVAVVLKQRLRPVRYDVTHSTQLTYVFSSLLTRIAVGGSLILI